MIIHTVPSTLLYEVSQISHRLSAINSTIAEENKQKYYDDLDRLLSIQEANRVMQNYHYMKETEWIRQYEFAASIKEQRLLSRATIRGIFVDRYV